MPERERERATVDRLNGSGRCVRPFPINLSINVARGPVSRNLPIIKYFPIRIDRQGISLRFLSSDSSTVRERNYYYQRFRDRSPFNRFATICSPRRKMCTRKIVASRVALAFFWCLLKKNLTMKTKHRFAAFYIPYTAARTSERVNSTSIREGESTFPLSGMGTGERDIVVNDCFVTHALRESFRFALCESILTPVNGCISGYKRRNRTLSTTIFRVRIPRLGRKNYVTK